MLKRIIRNLILGEKSSSSRFVAYLRKKGVQIGSDVKIYSPCHTLIDTTCPWLLTIGNHVRVTHGVIILTHDYSWSVLKCAPESLGSVLGAQSPVKIGNNVFIGMNAIITRGVTIGDNVVIGAGSIVTKDCESNSVYAGSPAKKIMTISEYHEKREALQFDEARKMARIYRERFNKFPPKEVFSEYFMLFCNLEDAKSVPEFCAQMENGEGLAESEVYMKNHTPKFDNYEVFLTACFEDEIAIGI